MHKRMLTSATLALLLAGGAAFAAEGAKEGAMGAQDSSQQQAASPSSSDPASQSGMQSGGSAQQASAEMTSDRLMDMNVRGSQNEEIGDVEKLVIDPQSGEIKGVVVSVGGFLGIGDKNVLLPWDQVQLAQDSLTTQATKEQLQQAQAWQDPDQQTAERRDTTAPAGSPGATGTAPGAAGSGAAGSGTSR